MKKLLITLCATTLLSSYYMCAMEQLSSLYSCASRKLSPYLRSACAVGGVAAAGYCGLRKIAHRAVETYTQNLCKATYDIGRSSVPLPDEIQIKISEDEFQSSPITFEIQKGQAPTSSLRIPQTIQDPHWRELFARGKLQGYKKNLSEQLETLINWQLADPEKDVIFLRKVVYILSHSMKNFESTNISLHENQKQFLRIKPECSYPLNITNEPNIMAISNKIQPSPILEIFIEAHGIKWIRPRVELQNYAPKLYAQLNTPNQSREDLYMVTADIAHEMVHIARRDTLVHTLTWKLLVEDLSTSESSLVKELGTSEYYSIRRRNEEQADLIASLALQENMGYFLGQIREYAIIFLQNISDKLEYLAHKYNSTDTNAQKINELFKKFFNSLPQAQNSTIANCALWAEQQTQTLEHPPVFRRIQSTLTTWTAYLVHEKNMKQNHAIDQITKRTSELFESFGITDNLIRQILDNIVYDWENMHRESQQK